MRKNFYGFLLVLSLVIISMSSVCSYSQESEEFNAWNLDEMIHQDLKQVFSKKVPENFTHENILEVQKRFVLDPESLPKDPAVEIHDEILDGKLRVRVYKPVEFTGRVRIPGLLWIHGGGHILGTPEGSEELLIAIVKAAKCIIAAPDYRLSPQFKYPADLDDCMTALRWLANNPDVDPKRIAVAGQSAGGGLTAAVTLKARDEGGPAICFQMPLYPMLDCRNIMPSTYQMRNDGRAWCRKLNVTAWEMYLGSQKPDIYASPALAENLANLPPAYIMVGTLDPFRDEAIHYAQKLMQAGIPVELHVIPRVTHGFEVLFPDTPISIKARDEYINALTNAFE